MNILINCSNLKVGGGVQVGDSICCSLYKYPQHNFLVVLSSKMDKTYKRIYDKHTNVKVVTYDVKNSIETIIRGRDKFLDKLVLDNHVDCVLTVFGPSRWNPSCKHLSGFAMPHLVIPESPFFTRMSCLTKFKHRLRNYALTYFFKRSTTTFFTENPYISDRLHRLLKRTKVYTITNYYNQIYDNPSHWIKYNLPPFKGVTLLTITAYYEHKNLEICIGILRYIKQKYSELNIRFVFTINKEEFRGLIPRDLEENIIFLGRVDINQCPSLYNQSDIMFQPSLLECFSATYAEAMKMEVPIVTTDLDFAHGLCGDAALYYSALSVEDAAEKIVKIVNNSDLRSQLVAKGKKQLMEFDNYTQRADKLIRILENL